MLIYKPNLTIFFKYFPAERSQQIIRALPVSRSLSIQLIDSFAQTDNVNPLNDDKMNTSIVDKDMVDSGVVAQLRLSDRTSITEDDEGAVSITYDDRYRCVSVGEEDEAVIVDNPSSQEVGVFDCL
jgi:hypothetical protein